MPDDPRPNAAWKPLRRGDSVYIIAPSSAPDSHEMEQTVAMFRSWGLNPIIAPGISEGHFNWGNTAQHRADQIITALNTEGVGAIFTMGGGEGASEVVMELRRREGELAKVRNCGVPLIGGSDITFLHHYLGERGVVSPVQGPGFGYMTTEISEERRSNSTPEQIAARTAAARGNQTMLHDFLMNENQPEPLPLTPISRAARTDRRIEGVLVGGNDQITSLSRFTTHGPTVPLHAAVARPILFLEGYTLAEMRDTLTQLRDSGDLNRYSGIVLGNYYEHATRQRGEGFPVEAAQRIVRDLGIDDSMPVFQGVPFGHPDGMFEQRPLALYTPTTIQAGGDRPTMAVGHFRSEASLHPGTLARFTAKNTPTAAPEVGQATIPQAQMQAVQGALPEQRDNLPVTGNVINVGNSAGWMRSINQLYTQETAGRHVVLHFNFNEAAYTDAAHAINPAHSFLAPLIAGGRLRDAASITISTDRPLPPEFNQWLGEFAARQLPDVPVHVAQLDGKNLPQRFTGTIKHIENKAAASGIQQDPGDHDFNSIEVPPLNNVGWARVAAQRRASQPLPGH